MPSDARWRSCWRLDRRTSSRTPYRCWSGCQACPAGWWRIGLQQPRLSRAHLGPGRTAGDPGPQDRGDAVMPCLGLHQPQPGRAPLGPTQGVARRCHPLREDRRVLRGRALPRRRLPLDQGLTGPRFSFIPFRGAWLAVDRPHGRLCLCRGFDPPSALSMAGTRPAVQRLSLRQKTADGRTDLTRLRDAGLENFDRCGSRSLRWRPIYGLT